MADIISNQLWAQRQQNQSGIRRLKLVDAESISLANGFLVPRFDARFYEFTFPSDLSCTASVSRQLKENGSGFWVQNIFFSLPHFADNVIEWADASKNVLWLAIAEDYNESTRLYGGSLQGLVLTFQASTGGSVRDANPMTFSLSAEQLVPFVRLPYYDDFDLFPNMEFEYGSFDSSFS